MTLLRRYEMCSLILLSASLAFANPKSTTFNAPVDDVFKAARKPQRDTASFIRRMRA